MTRTPAAVPYLAEIDYSTPEFVECFDELPLWSAPFGLMMLARLPLRTNMTIVDVGAGTGFLSIELAQRCGAGSRVIAVDPWLSAVQRLQRKLEHLQVRNVETLVQDAAGMQLADESVDLVVSNLGINNFDNAAAVLSACFRVTRPNGRLALTTNLVGHMQGFYDLYRASLRDCGLHALEGALEEHVQHRATVASLTAQLRAAGYTDVTSHTDSFPLRFADGSALLRHTFMRVGFMPAWKAIIPEADHRHFFTTLEGNLNRAAEAAGGLSFDVPMAYVDAVKR